MHTLLIFSITLCVVIAEPQSPLVAFLCNKPAVYMTDDGWVEDRTTDCIQEPEEILRYCKKVYPDKEITNVVESNDLVTIENWCGFNKEKCHKHNSHIVRPYRCLVGPFQSDALLVPEHCLFDHKHGSKCARHADWNITAVGACKGHNMKLQSFSMLQPCGTNVFNGVEFVCCPLKSDIPHQANPFIVEDDSNLLKTVEEAKGTKKPIIADNDPKDWKPMPKKVEKPEENEIFYEHYIKKSKDNAYLNEHEYFIKAKNDLQKHHHDRVTKMMKEWAEARQKVADTKAVDPKGAEKLEKDITARFQKTYEALEQEGMAEKKQLNAIHQQRVQSDLNDKKRSAMEHYMDILTDSSSDSSQILKALKHYIKMEEKDKLHAMNHFKHVHDTDSESEDALREQTLAHLDIIQQRIDQAIDMLKRKPEFEKKIRDQIADYLDTFRELNSAVNAVVRKHPEPEVSIEESNEEEIDSESKESQPKQEPQQEWENIKPAKPVENQPDVTKKDSKTVEKPPVPGENDIYRVPLEKTNDLRPWDDEIDEDEHDLPENHIPEMKVEHLASNYKNDKMAVQMNDPAVHKMNPVYSSGTSVGIAVAAIAVFVIIVAGVLVLRRRSQRTNHRGFVEVDQTASPEERHVANMQMNGYENPTYRYFEANQSA